MKKYIKLLQGFMIILILFGLLSPAVATVEPTTPRMSAALVKLIAEDPGGMIRVIVQKAGDSDQAERFVGAQGGEVLKDLGLIHGFAARIPASAVVQLASLDAVSRIALDAPVVSSGKPVEDPTAESTPNYFLDTLNVRQVWDMGYTGAGVGVAVIDSGISNDQDLNVVEDISFSINSSTPLDKSGHGTHVAGIVGNDGTNSEGFYMGVAPDADLINLKISDDQGLAYESDTVDALQWIFDNKDLYNIRVVNLSIQSTVEQSYHDSGINAAAEILWFNGVVVVAASGNWDWTTNNINPIYTAPANDPFLITVGATTEKGTTKLKDDVIASYSADGQTLDFFLKPEIYAPGTDIISSLALNSSWDSDYPERVVEVNNSKYFRISGTSMAAPMVSGAAALLLQAEPDLTPDQVKYRLVNASASVSKNPYLDVYAALTTPTTESANQDIIPHMLLAKMAMIAYWSSAEGEENIDWENVDWDAVNWDAVNWNAVNWNAVNWNAVNWNAVNWNAVNWNAVNWNAVNWNAVNWNAVNWNAVNWNAVNWNAVNWNATYWGEVE